MNQKRWLIAAVAVGATIFLAVAYFLVSPKVYSGVRLEGVEVGGKSREEVKQLLTVWRPEFRSRHIVVYYGDTTFALKADDIDYDLDVEATADEVWNYGRHGSPWERMASIRAAVREGYRVPVRVRYNESKLAAFFDEWREAIDRTPQNAALSLVTGGIIPQQPGRRLEVDALKPLVLQAMRQEDVARVPLPVTALYPEVTTADLEQTGLKEFWATFTTAFDASDINRSANIRLSARKINGYILYPGQTFSFNQVVGPRDKEHGFKEALEIVDGEFVPGIGGGVCQLSSTLYNAVLLADLAIAERYNHSKPLGYVGLGRDATVAYGVLDFKFINSSDSPVMIMAETEKNRLMVGIVGQRPLTEKVELLSDNRQVIPPPVVKKQDSDLLIGETKVDQRGKPGYEITTIRVVSAGGREIRREILAKDRYLPENTIVKVGTKTPPAEKKGKARDREDENNK